MKQSADFGYDMTMGFDVFGVTIFGKDYSKMTPMAVGLDYVTKFFQSSYFTGNRNPNIYIGLLASKLGATAVNRQIESLGNQIQIAKLSESVVKDSADELAKLAGNRYPAKLSDFGFSLIGQATATPFTDAIVDSVVIQKAQKLGDTLIKTGEATLAVAEATLETAGIGAKIVAFFPYIVPIVGVVGLYYFLRSDYFKEISKTAVSAYAGRR